MIIGIPKELKSNESRVAVTPAGVKELTKNNHTVYLQKNAGIESGFEDHQYVDAGAKILSTAEEVFALSDMVIKVKEPIQPEYNLIREGQIIFTYFHFASSEELTKAMIDSGAICIAYETVEETDRSLPLLIPMSEVAGRMAIQEGAKYLEKQFNGRGILLGGVPGAQPATVLIIGGGIVGMQAAKMAAGMGANVNIIDINLQRLRYLADILPANVNTLMSTEYNIRELIKSSDLIIGAVLIPGAKAPNLVTKDMLKEMKPGTVLIDVAVDQGGCIETCRPTTHENPTYEIDDIIHYCVANMPGAVPYTSTVALTNATLPYIISIANYGWIKACNKDEALMKGINIINGSVIHPKVAETFNLTKTEFSFKSLATTNN